VPIIDAATATQRDRIERGGLIDDAAEIDQLHEMTGHLTGALSDDAGHRIFRKKNYPSRPGDAVISISPMQIEP